MHNRVTPDQARKMTAKELATLPTDHLAGLLEAVNDLKADAARLSDKVGEALDLRFRKRAAALRAERGKEAGTVSFEDDGVTVRADLPQTVSWDADGLAAVAMRLRADGADPAELMEMKYTVRESRFKAWPASLQALFMPARTTGFGKPSYKLEVRDNAGRR